VGSWLLAVGSWQLAVGKIKKMKQKLTFATFFFETLRL
jgi:hypothetical protein